MLRRQSMILVLLSVSLLSSVVCGCQTLKQTTALNQQVTKPERSSSKVSTGYEAVREYPVQMETAQASGMNLAATRIGYMTDPPGMGPTRNGQPALQQAVKQRPVSVPLQSQQKLVPNAAVPPTLVKRIEGGMAYLFGESRGRNAPPRKRRRLARGSEATPENGSQSGALQASARPTPESLLVSFADEVFSTNREVPSKNPVTLGMPEFLDDEPTPVPAKASLPIRPLPQTANQPAAAPSAMTLNGTRIIESWPIANQAPTAAVPAVATPR